MLNCSILPQSVRLARMAYFDPLAGLPSFHPVTAHKSSTDAPGLNGSATQDQCKVPVERRKAVARD